MLVNVRKGEVAVHAGGYPVFIESGQTPPVGLQVQSIRDDGQTAIIQCASTNQNTMRIELDRREHWLRIRRRVAGDWQFWSQGEPERRDNLLVWKTGVKVSVQGGSIANWEPEGFAGKLSVGNGLLDLADPAPRKYPRGVIRPKEEGETVIEVELRRRD